MLQTQRADVCHPLAAFLPSFVPSFGRRIRRLDAPDRHGSRILATREECRGGLEAAIVDSDSESGLEQGWRAALDLLAAGESG